MKVFAERLRELRVERYLTQAQLAKEIGVVQSSIVLGKRYKNSQCGGSGSTCKIFWSNF